VASCSMSLDKSGRGSMLRQKLVSSFSNELITADPPPTVIVLTPSGRSVGPLILNFFFFTVHEGERGRKNESI
jgi:hypothetical protein